MVSIESNLRVDDLSYGARLDGKKFQRLEYFEQAVGIPIVPKVKSNEEVKAFKNRYNLQVSDGLYI